MASTVVLALTGCAPQQPHDVTLPELVWDGGIEPSSPLEAEPDVIFARKAALALAYAYNTGDFAFRFLVDNYPSDDVEGSYRSYLGAATPQNNIIYPGQFPFQPLTLEPSTFDIVNTDEPSTYTLLTFCGSGNSPWAQWETEQDTSGIFDSSKALTGLMIIGHRPDYSRFVELVSYTGSTSGPGQPCDGTQVPVGRFDPPFPFANTPVIEAPYPPLN